MQARRVGAVVALALVAACAPKTDTPPPVDTAAVRRFIEGENVKYIDAMKRGDSTAASMNYAEAAILMPPNAPALRGRTAIVGNLGASIRAMAIVDEKATTEDVMVKDDVAVETGSFVYTMQPRAPAGAKAFSGRGKYITIWKRQADGGWKIVRDINNGDTPSGK